MAKPFEVDDSSFKTSVLEADIPTVVDFWAIWCGPCKMLAPILDDIAREYEGKLQVAKLDVDQNGESAIKYGVMNIPTLILFKGGQPVERIVGFMPKEKLMARLKPHLG